MGKKDSARGSPVGQHSPSKTGSAPPVDTPVDTVPPPIFDDMSSSSDIMAPLPAGPPAMAMSASLSRSGRAKEWAKKSHGRAQAAAETLSSALSSQVDRVARRAAHTSARMRNVVEGKKPTLAVIQAQDQFTFTVSIINILGAAFGIGVVPHYFYLWHTFTMVVLLTRRWWHFRLQGHHYYLYDFCYWGNYLSVVYCCFARENTTMMHIWFMSANGPLAGAVVAFSQGFVFHSASHMTSLFIHMSPMLLSWAVRWYPGPWKVCENPPSCDDVSVFHLLRVSYLYFYLVWVVLYYGWVYVVMERRIQERGYETLFEWVVNQKPMAFLRTVSSNILIQKATYMAVHAAFAFVMMCLAVIMFFSWHFHTLSVVAIICIAAYNSSGYYFAVFAKRYVDELQKRALTLEESRQVIAATIAAAPRPS
jgi:hypothetical protein